MTPMVDRANVGSVWRRKRDKTIWRVRMSHRMDRLALCDLISPDPIMRERQYVRFDVLRDKYEQLR